MTFAHRRLGGAAPLEVIPGATHLSQEPGALDTVADLARRWFSEHLPAARPAPPSQARP